MFLYVFLQIFADFLGSLDFFEFRHKDARSIELFLFGRLES
jgi:hypothetical protein